MGELTAIARRLRVFLDENGVEYCEVARRLGVSPAAVSHWLSGRRVMGVDVLTAICEEFDVSCHWLFTGEGPMRCSELRVLLSSLLTE